MRGRCDVRYYPVGKRLTVRLFPPARGITNFAILEAHICDIVLVPEADISFGAGVHPRTPLIGRATSRIAS